MTSVEYVTLGPSDENEALIFAEEGFRVDFQQTVHELMQKKGTSQKQLAQKLHVSEARVSQIFSEKCNVTVRMIARIFFALDERPQIVFKDRLGSANVYTSVESDRHDGPANNLASQFSHVRNRMVQSSGYSVAVAEAAA